MLIKVLQKVNKHIILALFIFAFLLCLPMIFFDDIPCNDVASRYAPMADAFARGDWTYAFHPRVPLLVPVLAGGTAVITGCSGFFACKLVSALFFALTIFPVYGIMKKVFTEKVAVASCLLTIFCSHLMRLAYSGLRDSAKGFAFILAIYGLIILFRERKKFPGYLICASGAGLLLISRGDCALYAVVIMLSCFIFEIFDNKSIKFPFRSLIGCGVILVVSGPALIYNYYTIGYPVPEARIGIVLSKVTPFIYNKNAKVKLHHNNLQREIAGRKRVAVNIQKAARKKESAGATVSKFISGLVKGFYPYFFILAIAGMIFRIKRREWQPEETILLVALLGHAALIVLQILFFDGTLYVSRRYLLPVTPLAFGWSAIFIFQAWSFLGERFPVCINYKTAVAVSIVVASALYLDGALPVMKSYFNDRKSKERDATLQISGWINGDYKGSRYIEREMVWNSYRSNLCPLVFCPDLEAVGYLAGGQNVSSGKLGKRADYIIVKLDKRNYNNSDFNSINHKTFKFSGDEYMVIINSAGESK